MKVEQQQSGDDGSFYIQKDNQRIAESQYTMIGDNTMDIFHTQVEQEYQGEHLGDQLIKEAVNYARQHHLKISPTCSFARAMFERHQEFKDVLAKS